MKKKLSIGLVLAMVAMLAAMTALAAGLTFSNNFDVKRAALDAIEEKYGITGEMLTIFRVSESEPDEHGAQVVTLTPVEWQYAERVGQYAATVQGGKVTASWSHDGEEIGEGIESQVYGAEQIALLCTNYAEVMQYLYDAAEGIVPEEYEMPEMPEDIEAYLAERERAWAEAKAAAETSAKFTLEECINLARGAVKNVYGLSDEQIAKMVLFEDEDRMLFTLEDGHPVVSFGFWLTQVEGEEHHEKDGQYWVDVNMDTGVIEDMLYDSGMASNG